MRGRSSSPSYGCYWSFHVDAAVSIIGAALGVVTYITAITMRFLEKKNLPINC